MQNCIYSLIQDENFIAKSIHFCDQNKILINLIGFLFYFKTDIRLYFLVQWAATLKIKDNHIALYIDL